ncbi:hypothetical protein ONE63_008679 [Megalurothrips usitatus]|uniref:Uncharacterized protein n=1 Tax=Megalurothrips usitatus TaxID=439358 RepID=A0AAV7XUK6_9NEOP|nr:hypothetical protein ONE63_008679 [Megalurothrips usitatus]
MPLSLVVLAVLGVLLLPPAAPRPAAHDVGLLRGHAADGLGFGMGLGRPAVALPFIGQDDDDDMPLVGKRALAAAGPGPGAVANLVGRPDLASQDYEYSSGRTYDEYPMIVPRAAKRTAVMVDRLFGMLKNAVNGDVPSPGLKAIAPDDRMDLQRRGQQKGRVYWRCYFNAVTCFRRK